MVNKLMEVSEAAGENIQIDIICRGICSLVPRRENIRVKSIVGRFLEHSRIYTFTRGNKTKVFISSADLLTRNLDKRIETLIPITDSKCKKKILSIFNAQLDDTANSWDMDENGNFKQVDTKYGNLEENQIPYRNTQNECTK
jgi:polyphosphate kinase